MRLLRSGGRRSFKFENLWLKERNCRDLVANCWDGTRGLQLLERLESCSRVLWDWGKKTTINFLPKLNYWAKRMENLRNCTDQNSTRLFSEAQRNYLRLLEQENYYWKQRAKTFWFQGGDINSSFFHKTVKKRRNNNSVQRLKNTEGIWCHKGPELNQYMLHYFHNLFQSSIGNMEPVLSCIQQRVSHEHNTRLLRRVTCEEVKIAMFSMHSEKSQGPDGFNPAFYQAYWDILGQDLVNLCDNFIQNGYLPTGINRTQITLIPKKSKPESMGDLRPISLCNVVYKLVAKVVANRMKPLLEEIVSHNQSAFCSRKNDY